MTAPWPEPTIDQIRRLRVLAAGVSGAQVSERYIDAPFARVWDTLSDLEGSFGLIEPDMKHLKVLQLEGERVEALARSRYGMRARLEGVLRPGWCWLQSRFLIIGIAAVPDGKGTRVAMTGGVRIPGRAALVPIGVRGAAQKSLQRLAKECERPS